MSLIEKAVQRLDQLKQASGEPTPEVDQQASVPSAQPDAAPVMAKPSAAVPSTAVPSAAVAPTPPAGQQDQSATASVDDALSRPVARAVEIDLRRLAALGMVTPDKPKSMLAEQFRVIKRPLISNARGEGAARVENGNMIMVGSALPGEGKSFSAINLAMSMAMELDFTVLLVDADFARPSILAKLGIPHQKGLMDVLAGNVPNLSDVILRTNVEKLALLPAGMPQPRATEMIASDAMAAMLDEISGRYSDRIIVFDSPPLIPTTEARVLATHMGQIVIVVEADRTSHGAVRHALATIENCPVKLMLLNKASASETSGLYGYGYGYGYGADTRTEAAA